VGFELVIHREICEIFRFDPEPELRLKGKG